MKKFAALPLVFALLIALAACVGSNGAAFRGTDSADAETVTSAAPTEAAVPSESAAPPETVSRTEPDAPMEPTDTTLPSESGEDALKLDLKELFSCPVSFYNRALASAYADPADADLFPFFYDGIPGLDKIEEEDGQCERMPRAEMDRVLLQYFGLTLDETAGRGLERFGYDAETNCYCNPHSDAFSLALRVDDARKLEDGTILFTYCNLDYSECHKEPGSTWTAGLKPDGAGNYQFLFNLPGEWVTPEDSGESDRN